MKDHKKEVFNRAQKIIQLYDGEVYDNVVDAISDLMHLLALTAGEGVISKRIDEAIDTARMHFQVEIHGDAGNDETYQMFKGIKELAESENSPAKEARLAFEALEIGKKAAKGKPDCVLHENTVEAYDQLLNKNVL